MEERLDFSSIIKTIREYGFFPENQVEFYIALFDGYVDKDCWNKIVDAGGISNMYCGQRNVHVIIREAIAKDIRPLVKGVEESIVPGILDRDMVRQKLIEIIHGDVDISQEKAMAFTEMSMSDDEQSFAEFLAAILSFGIQRKFYKRIKGVSTFYS